MSAGEFVERLVAARAAWQDIELAAAASNDPQAIEHATIAGLAMQHLEDQLRAIDDELADELERERYGDLGEAVA